MSLVQIQKQSEPEDTLMQRVVLKDEKLTKRNNPKIKWEEIAGLSWILLNKGDEM